MSIRRKSTTHDLATLRLHPDGSRVQQSSINRRTRTAPSTVPDTRGNWIARDAGGKAAVRKTRNTSARADDEDGEFIDIRLSDELVEEELTVRTSKKGKQKATESDSEDSGGKRTGRNFRARKRRSFTDDWSFLAPSPPRVFPQPESTSEDDSSSYSSDSDSESEEIKITLPDPSPELLKCIHHFASRYYQEQGVLSDRSRGFRDERKTRRSKKSAINIHDQTTRKPALWTRDSSLDAEDDEDEWEDEEDEREDGEDEWEDEDEDMEDGENPSRNDENVKKDMYKALDGSALVAIGIILQEQIAHAMTAGFPATHAHPVRRQRDDFAELSSSLESD
ncbi:uncharacterized protein EDB91DRAFT_513116 [Suillus paluster]|uniref:uncharacterized protein n=1 Tax=Suillus paluster TaxID=48578 RepID=UPI001B8814D5|nr:uncharacterized protein EDB91DRAFT_513116 [Suillus paluster]KAG1752384.1 hypothetical protein EDB91DRAFT_513116 [Suillus paluster]